MMATARFSHPLVVNITGDFHQFSLYVLGLTSILRCFWTETFKYLQLFAAKGSTQPAAVSNMTKEEMFCQEKHWFKTPILKKKNVFAC